MVVSGNVVGIVLVTGNYERSCPFKGPFTYIREVCVPPSLIIASMSVKKIPIC